MEIKDLPKYQENINKYLEEFYKICQEIDNIFDEFYPNTSEYSFKKTLKK